MKFPLSVTTGPAFARAMRRVAFGELSVVCRLRRTEVCANGETSMGTPEMYLGCMVELYVRVEKAKLTLVPRTAEFFR
jgi:hypothetical protein